MPVNSIMKTSYEQCVHTFYLIDPSTGLPVGDVGTPVHVAAVLDDEWEIVTIEDAGLNDSDKTVVVPAGMEYQILWVYASLATTATVGNRNMAVAVNNTLGTQIFEVRTGVTQAASLTYNYTFAPSLADLTAVRDTTFVMTPLPPTLLLTAGQQLRVWDQNAVAAGADDLSLYVQVARRIV